MCINLMTELDKMIRELSLRVDKGGYSSEIRQRVSYLEGRLSNLKAFKFDKDNECDYKKRVDALKKVAKMLKVEMDEYDDRKLKVEIAVADDRKPDLERRIAEVKQKENSNLFGKNTKKFHPKDKERE